MTLEELIIRCKKQDAQAQKELYTKYNRILFAICIKYAPSIEEAEDCLQDAFITIFQKINQYSGKGSFEGWMKRITVNTVLQKYRRDKTVRMQEDVQLYDDEEDTIEAEEIPLEFLLKIVQELPTQYRLVFSMYVLDGYSHKEIAEQLKISEGTSKSNLARAKGILRIKINTFSNQGEHK